MKKIKQIDGKGKVPKKVLKVWGSSESEVELSDSNFSTESSPSWQSQPTWGSSGGGGYFDALFANGSTSPKGASLMSPTGSENSVTQKYLSRRLFVVFKYDDGQYAIQ